MIQRHGVDAGWHMSGRGNGAGRQGWAGVVTMLAGTLAVALVSYSISMAVSAERSAAERLARENATLAHELKALDAEFRVRMRLPQLERWNRDVLGLQPIEASQFLDSPLLLASYGMPAPAAAGTAAPVPAVVRDAPAAVASSPPQIRTVVADRAPPPAVAIDPALLAAVAALADAPGPAPQARPQLTTVALDRLVAAPADPPGQR